MNAIILATLSSDRQGLWTACKNAGISRKQGGRSLQQEELRALAKDKLLAVLPAVSFQALLDYAVPGETTPCLANFILATRLWLAGFLAHDVIDVRVSWNAPEWIHAQIRLPTFFDNSFRCADEATMQQWIDQHPRLRGLPPLAALHRKNCLDNMAPNEFDAFLCALRSGSARFMYTPAVEGSEADSPVFGPALITLLCCESLPLALCVRRVGCLQQQATTP